MPSGSDPAIALVNQVYRDLEQAIEDLLGHLTGDDGTSNPYDYVLCTLARLIFIYGLQQQGRLDQGDEWYLQNKLGQSQMRGCDRFFREVWQPLLYQGLILPEGERPAALKDYLGSLPYLGGDIFPILPAEQRCPQLHIADGGFEPILERLSEYSWHITLTPPATPAITPTILGQAFERLINQRTEGLGALPPSGVETLLTSTVDAHLLQQLQALTGQTFATLSDALHSLTPDLARVLVTQVLPELTILDPACGSGRWLVAALQRLAEVYGAIYGVLQFAQGRGEGEPTWWKPLTQGLPATPYRLQRGILERHLYGVDLSEATVEVARLQLWLALVAALEPNERLDPLPSLAFSILPGNALIGLIRVDEARFETVQTRLPKGSLRDGSPGPDLEEEPLPLQGNLLQPLQAETFQTIQKERQIRLENFKAQTDLLAAANAIPPYAQLEFLRNHVHQINHSAQAKLNYLLLEEFSQTLGITYQQYRDTGQKQKRLLTLEDIADLSPLHWGYHFHAILTRRGGFDIILSHPPWHQLKPRASEFFTQYTSLMRRQGLTAPTWQKHRRALLQSEPLLAAAWRTYQSQFPHQRTFFQQADGFQLIPQPLTDLRLEVLFLQRCLQLLRPGGVCGLLWPTHRQPTDLSALEQSWEVMVLTDGLDSGQRQAARLLIVGGLAGERAT